MAISVDLFLERFSEFNGFKSEDIVESMLLESELFFPVSEWDNQIIRDLVIQLLTAHNLELQRQSILDTGDRLYFQRETVDKEVKVPEVNYYQQTRYGMQLWDLISANTLGALVL
jgi:hypothetical protein